MLGKHLFMTILRAACCLLAAFVYVPGAARADDGMHLGYGKERTVTFLPVTDRGTGGSALYFPVYSLQRPSPWLIHSSPSMKTSL